MDLSGDNITKSKKSFLWLCKNRLQSTKVLNLSNWEEIIGKDILVWLLFACHFMLSYVCFRTLSLDLIKFKRRCFWQVLSKYCNKLQSISLSRCTKLNSSALRGLVESCSDLTDIDLSVTSVCIVNFSYRLQFSEILPITVLWHRYVPVDQNLNFAK